MSPRRRHTLGRGFLLHPLLPPSSTTGVSSPTTSLTGTTMSKRCDGLRTRLLKGQSRSAALFNVVHIGTPRRRVCDLSRSCPHPPPSPTSLSEPSQHAPVSTFLPIELPAATRTAVCWQPCNSTPTSTCSSSPRDLRTPLSVLSIPLVRFPQQAELSHQLPLTTPIPGRAVIPVNKHCHPITPHSSSTTICVHHLSSLPRP